MASRHRTFFAARGRLGAVFLLVSGIPMAAVGWLGWRFIEQDRLFDAQRLEEQLENSANLLLRELERGFADWEGQLDTALASRPAKLPPDGLLLVYDRSGVRSRTGVALPYYPAGAAQAEAPEAAFQAARDLEFREEDLDGAQALYRQLAEDPDPLIRAGALMRLARTLRHQGHVDEALDAYDELLSLSDTPVGGAPAELLALRERVELLAMTDKAEASRHAAGLLANILAESRYLLDRPSFDFYAESASPPIDDAAPGFALAAAVTDLWPLWQTESAGRAGRSADGRLFAAAWRETDGVGAAIVAPLATLTEPLNAMLADLDVQVALEEPEGHLAWGRIPEDADAITRMPGQTGLPWTLRVAADPATTAFRSASRRNLLIAGLLVMLLATGGASYATFRALRRELDVARVQSDFVAAVSHEFRTPLTAMRHLTDILEEGRTEPDRLPHYYRALGKETRRLHAMVENLLDFARMESGRRVYDLQVLDAGVFTAEVVEEFRGQAAAEASPVRFENAPKFETAPASDDAALPIRADRDALALALRNIIDNAVKYSPESLPVAVSIERSADAVGIHVRDAGPGIPKAEQADVFAKFTRGSASRAGDVKGTGIGLTIAQQIVAAHDGRLELESEPGHGSCFTIWLPLAKGDLDR